MWDSVEVDRHFIDSKLTAFMYIKHVLFNLDSLKGRFIVTYFKVYQSYFDLTLMNLFGRPLVIPAKPFCTKGPYRNIEILNKRQMMKSVQSKNNL